MIRVNHRIAGLERGPDDPADAHLLGEKRPKPDWDAVLDRHEDRDVIDVRVLAELPAKPVRVPLVAEH